MYSTKRLGERLEALICVLNLLHYKGSWARQTFCPVKLFGYTVKKIYTIIPLMMAA